MLMSVEARSAPTNPRRIVAIISELLLASEDEPEHSESYREAYRH